MRALISILFALSLLWAANAVGQNSKTLAPTIEEPCGCDDLAHIEYRLREADVAIREQKDALNATGALMLNTPSNYGDSQKALQAALDAYAGYATLQPGEAGGEQAHTTWDTANGCQTVLPSPKLVHVENEFASGGVTETWKEWKPTRCLIAIIKQHEDKHMEKCNLLHEGAGLGRWLLLKDKISEEIEAYTAEREYLLAQRERLLCTCPYYQLTLHESRTLPRPADMSGNPITLALKTVPPRPVQGEQEGLQASLQPNPGGELEGTGEGTIGGDIAFRGVISTVSGNTHHPFTFHISADEPPGAPLVHTILEIDARDDSGIDLVAKNPVAKVELHSNLQGQDVTMVESQKTNPCFGGSHPTCGTSVRHVSVTQIPQISVKLDFAELESPRSCTLFSPRRGVREECKASFDISEHFKNALASNGFGSTVGAALKAIAAKNHTVIAACGRVKEPPLP